MEEIRHKKCGRCIGIINTNHTYTNGCEARKSPQQERHKRFDERFVFTYTGYTRKPPGTESKDNHFEIYQSQIDDLKSFIDEEVELAVTKREKEVMEIIDENIKTINDFTGDGFVTDNMGSFAIIALRDTKNGIINLINNSKNQL